MQKYPVFFLLVLTGVIGTLGVAQQPGIAHGSNDKFIGKWALNVAKSSLPPERETLTIETLENRYKITCVVVYGSGTELDFWTASDMEGTPSKVTQADGRPMNEEWRVTRESETSFVVESRPVRTVYKYTVSADGKSLTQEQISSSTVGGKAVNGTLTKMTPRFVFDRTE